METVKKNMINEARKKYTKIFPCKTYSNFGDSFTRYKNRVYFWFNTRDRSTHVLVYTLPLEI